MIKVIRLSAELVEQYVVRIVTQKLFKELGPMGSKKHLTFKKRNNFTVDFSYDSQSMEKDP